jgi:hypothetical protein
MLKAFCRVAPSVRFRDLAIFLAGVFLRANALSSRTCADVQARLFFDPFFISISMSGAGACSSKLVKRKAPRTVRGGA